MARFATHAGPINRMRAAENMIGVIFGPAGGDGYLDGIETAAGARQLTDALFYLNTDTELMEAWYLAASSAATDSEHQRPLDYNALTNQVCWIKYA